MHFLMKATIPVDVGNDMVKDPDMGDQMETVMGDLKPEAVYFCLEGGQRTIYFLVNVQDSSEIPSLCEPLWHTFSADVEMIPAMTQDEFGVAMNTLGEVMKKY